MRRSNTPRLLLSLTLLLLSAVAARAQTEGPVVWEVQRFDVTANVPAPAAERRLNVRAIIQARNAGQGTGRTFTARINPAAEIKTVTVGDAAARFDATRTEARTGLKTIQTTLPAPVAPGGIVSVAYDYTLPVQSNSGLAALAVDGAQFLPLPSEPLSFWYPTPNSPAAPRGADMAPLRLTVNAPAGDSVVSTGRLQGQTFEQTLLVQPFFVTGKWDAVEGAGEAKGVSAHIPRGASAEERQRAESLVALAGAARGYFATLLGPAPDVPVRLVAVRRGTGFDMGGTVLLDAAAFRRPKTDALTALAVTESIAHLWLGGATAIRGDGAGALREGLARYLAAEFLGKHLGAEAAEAERLRERIAYAAIAQRDAPLSLSTPFEPTYFTSAANKGAMVWRLAARTLGAEAFNALLRAQLEAGRAGGLTLPAFRAALVGRGGAPLSALLEAGLDRPTEIDLLVGLPQPRAGEQSVALRNTGPVDVTVAVAATTDRGERLLSNATIKARDFGEAVFKSAARIVRVEVDPEKLYPQTNYANDAAPAAPALEESLAEATRTLAAQEFARSETVSREMLARAPLMQDARILHARALLSLNRLDEAEREFRAAADSPLPLPDTLAWAAIGSGEIALRRGQAAEASRRFGEAVGFGGSYAPAFAARGARLRADTAPPVEEAVRAVVAQLDQAIKSGRKTEIDQLIAAGELENFSKGIVGSQPEQWQTKVLRTESLGGERVAADVQITSRILGQDKSCTGVLVFTRAGGRLQLIEIPILEGC